MIFDAKNLFSASQVVTDDAASTNVIDLGVAGRDIGVGEDLYFVVIVDATVTQSGSGTVEFQLETSDTDFSGETDIYTSAAIPKADLTAGTVAVKVKVPTGVKRYLRAYYNVSETLLTGSFTAGLTKDIDAFTSKPSGYTVAA